MAATTKSLPTYPNKNNFCGGNFQDWLEVNLLPECNAKCSWCIEKKGWHPTKRASWEVISQAAIKSGKNNIILLGGEPTLYKNLKPLVDDLVSAGRRVWITTNGFLLERKLGSLNGIAGVNISIHHYDLIKNEEIVHLKLNCESLSRSISHLVDDGASVRFNCNLINGYIDSKEEMFRYIEFAKYLGATNVRFAELKQSNSFVDLFSEFGNEHGITNDPFLNGCNSDAVINGMPVNFRQMCGLQTSHRKHPENPVLCAKDVLYYDGELYKGWQSSNNLSDKALRSVLSDVASGKLEVEKAMGYLNV